MRYWTEYQNFKHAQIVKKYQHSYPISKGKMPLFSWAGFDGIDTSVWIPKTYSEWLTNRKKMKEKHKRAHMRAAFAYAECSTAKRLQVGCVIVKDDRIISIGYNGMPSGWTNECETDNNVTKPEVLHAESNAICKLARSSENGTGATAFVTHQPCMDCAKLLYQSGITEVYYVHEYRLTHGVDFLEKCGIKVEQMSI